MIVIEKKLIAYDSITCSGVEPQHLCIKKEDILKYVEEHPFPDYEDSYNLNDFIDDITRSTGLLTFPEDLDIGTIEYIEELLSELAR